MTEEEFRANVAEGSADARLMTRAICARRSVDDTIALHERVAAADRAPVARRRRRRSSASLRGGGKLLVFGNGGSAADAQHVAAELVGRFLRERQALAGDRADDRHERADEHRQRLRVRSRVRAADRGARPAAATWRSASARAARSANVVAALAAARTRGLRTIALTGRDGGPVGRGRGRFTSTCRPTSTRARPGSAPHAAARDLRSRRGRVRRDRRDETHA